MLANVTRQLRTCARSCAVAATVLTGGCFDVDQTVVVKADSSVALDTAVQFDSEVEDIAAFFEEFGSISKDAEMMKDGLCGAFQNATKDQPPPGASVTSKQFTIGGKFVCQVRVAMDNASSLETDAALGSILQVKNVGERRVLVSLNLSNIPDFAEAAKQGMVQSMLSDPNLPGAQSMPPDKIDTIWKKAQTASTAATRLFLRDRKLSITLQAPRIVETNGTLDAAQGKVTFSFPFTDLVEMLMVPEKRKDKNFFAVLEY